MRKIRILMLLALSQFVNAQQFKNALNLEIGGTGLVYSVGYERFVKNNFSISLGTSYLTVNEKQTEKNLKIMSFPISTSSFINIGNKRHFAEVGVGVMNLITNGNLIEFKGETNHYLNPYLKLGYRFIPTQNRWQYKVMITPFWASKSSINPTQQGFRLTGGVYQIWGGMALGYRF